MKKTYLTIAFAIAIIAAIAQPAAITVFSDNEPLILTIDGKKINETPQTSVTAWDINAENIKIYVQLANQKEINLSQNIMVRPGMEMKTMVKQDKKGNWVLRYQGEGAMPTKTVVQEPVKETATIAVQSNSQSEQVTISTNTGTTKDNVVISATISGTQQTNGNLTISATSSGNGETENVSINAQIGGNGLNMAVTNSTTTTTTTVSSGSTTTTSTTNLPIGATINISTTETVSSSNQTNEPANTETSIGCTPMSSSDFISAKTSIGSKTFEDSKITEAKQIIKANCLRAEQIKLIMELMEFEDSRLTIAKFAYQYCFDKGNYFKVNDAFQYELTIEELNKFIEVK